MTYEIVAMTPDRELVLKGSGATFEAVDHMRFEDIADGTRLIYRAEVMFHKPLRQPVDRLMEWVFRRASRKALNRLQVMLSGAAKRPSLEALAQLADRAVVPGLIGFTRLGYVAAKTRRPVASTLYAGRTMVLTGGTSGIGRAAAGGLFSKGAHLVVVGRDPGKLKRLKQELKETGGPGRIDTEIADLSVLADVGCLAERLRRRYGRIHVLINNAGALFNRYGKTREGIEQTLATDLLSPFLLTRLLLPSLSAATDARVVNVASGGMYTQGVHKDFLRSAPDNYDGPAAYAQAKRGLVILTELWARELAPLGISVHAMHPGWVDTPGLQKALPAFRRYLLPLLRSPAQGADTIVWLAAAPDAARASGRFWLDRKIRATHVFPRTRLSARECGALVKVLEELCRPHI
jgi:NAD(P)-dependent dehydrogenase (short-subunit alcohol dehydrogenase family)